MNVTEFLVRARRQLDDNPGGAAADDWDDSELVEIANDQMQAMAQEMAEKNQGWHNYEFDLLATGAVQSAGQDFDYVFPSRAIWRVTRMWQMPNGLDPASPRGQPVFYVDPSDRDPGFYFVHSHKFRIQNYATAQDLRVQAVRIPSKITRGTLPAQTGMSPTQLRIDADTTANALLFPHERETNGYANAVVEITGLDVAAPLHAVSGQIRRVVSSAHLVVEAGVLYTVLTLDEAWTTQPVAADAFDLHLELHDTHSRYFILLCARQAWLKKGAKDEIAAMRDELGKREVEWRQSLTARQTMNPQVVRITSSTRRVRSSNFDSDDGVLSN